MLFGNKNKPRQASYVELHNSAVLRYRRACKTFIWAGVVNLVGLIVGVIQYYAQGQEYLPFFYCFGVNDFLFTLLEPILGLNSVWFWLIVAAMLLITTSGAVLLGLFSSQGKKVILFIMLGVYLTDWIMAFLAFFVAGESWIGLLINAGIHVIVSFFLVVALYQYYNVINIEKRFKNIPTVAEQKAKKEKEKEVEVSEDGN